MSVKRRSLLGAAVAAPMMAQTALVGRRGLPRAGATVLRYSVEQFPSPTLQFVIHLWYHNPEGLGFGDSGFHVPNATRLPTPAEIIQLTKQEVVRFAKQHTPGIDITVQDVVVMTGLLFV